MTTDDDNAGALLVGKLILAIADQDYVKAEEAIAESEEVLGGWHNLMAEVAWVAIASCQHMAGENWRSWLVTTMNQLEIQQLGGDLA